MNLKIKRYGPRDWQVHPPYLYEHYRSTPLRSPRKPLIPLTPTLSELTGPVYGHDAVQPGDSDLTTNAGRGGEAIGERIIVTGRVLE
ncbi:MAG: protocatechuate 3,4-dioxygenase subunit beta, partial [Deltaproteobacteria bacterium]|nr:protocatechuate 3,4-dioxygenase subunit beta [Deltaproteobacteria bacterium]